MIQCLSLSAKSCDQDAVKNGASYINMPSILLTVVAGGVILL